jgi:hypothetical protein
MRKEAYLNEQQVLYGIEFVELKVKEQQRLQHLLQQLESKKGQHLETK